ncbi:hypothetical protein J6590_084348 [Homalodisca vitripennis]|nr:hypothetical protein J6590_084348 [Homalodisca vitripennis]
MLIDPYPLPFFVSTHYSQTTTGRVRCPVPENVQVGSELAKTVRPLLGLQKRPEGEKCGNFINFKFPALLESVSQFHMQLYI